MIHQTRASCQSRYTTRITTQPAGSPQQCVMTITPSSRWTIEVTTRRCSGRTPGSVPLVLLSLEVVLLCCSTGPEGESRSLSQKREVTQMACIASEHLAGLLIHNYKTNMCTGIYMSVHMQALCGRLLQQQHDAYCLYTWGSTCPKYRCTCKLQ